VTPGYRVRIAPSGWNDPLDSKVGIHVIDVGYAAVRCMTKDGTWVEVEEGGLIEPTLSIPVEAMEALAEAIDRYRGVPSHAKTEAAVLREELAKEQSRVDRMLEAGK
jgi:hypothetical protein